MTARADESAFLMVYGTTDRNAWQCPNAIVANEAKNVRRGHKCCEHGEHKGRHACGCGQAWWYDKRYKKWRTEGPLTDVATCDDIEWGPNREKFAAEMCKYLRGEDTE